MLVKNTWKRPIRLGRETLRKGEVANIPDHILIQPRPLKLRKAEKIKFPYVEEQVEKKDLAPTTLKKGIGVASVQSQDNLELLPNIGPERRKLLHNAGILTFDEIVDRSEELSEILGISDSLVEEIAVEAGYRVE